MTEYRKTLPEDAPAVEPAKLREIASGVWVIPDQRVPLVPNIGIIEGERSVLVVDTGMGPVNGAAVLRAAKNIAAGRPLILTITHFHPEHGFGAQEFKGTAHIIYNASQRDELAEKGARYLEMFRGFGPGISAALEGTEIIEPDEVYEGSGHRIDLGGRIVELKTWGLAHTKGDQVVWLPAERILFTGDLAEDMIFPIFPWFPPDDADLDAARWSSILAELEGMEPAIAVPGHGAVRGPEVLAAVRQYMAEVSSLVAGECAKGKDAGTIAAEHSSAIRASRPDWDAPEWIDFAIRYYASSANREGYALHA